jgi:hypothetical protein
MKSFVVNALFAAFFLFCYAPLRAQNCDAKPDQLRLIKQFVGQWKAEIGQDSTITAEYAVFGNGLEGKSTISVGSNMLKESRQMFGYDSKTDTFIEAEMSTNSELELWACWFSSETLFVGLPLAYLGEPTKAIFKVEVLIQSPDSFVQSVYKNGTIISQKTMKRVTETK